MDPVTRGRVSSRLPLDRRVFIAVLSGLMLTTCALPASSSNMLEVGRFSDADPGRDVPDGWKPLIFPKIDRHTDYALVKDDGVVVVQATSEAASSGLVREMEIDPRTYPIVRWRWKIANLLKTSDVTRKAGDDYPARLYITFAYDSTRVGFWEKAKYEAIRLVYGAYPPLAALNYIWATKAAQGAIVPNPYTDRAMMVVVESGPQRVGQWVTEERDILADYRRAFGKEPPMISGVAIMTDTDNTRESAAAYYGDITFLAGSGAP